jgi:hypothetical protein
MYRSDYEALVSNPVWKEMVETLNESAKGLYADLRELDPHLEPSSISKQQGRLLMLEFVLGLPSIILAEIEENNKKLEETEVKDGE